MLDGGFYLWDWDPWLTIDPERFLVFRISEKRHVIMDKEDRREEEVTVLTSQLLDPKFCLAKWYDRKVSVLRGVDPNIQREWAQGDLGPKMSMETPLAAQVEQLLVRRGRYDNDPICNAQHPQRFECARMDDGTYLIRDYVRSFVVQVPLNLLLNHKFQLASWYNKRLREAHDGLCDELMHNSQEFHML
ncbi:hypothetical protein DFH29DRAFT_810095 [Suillus ampliporus]|nr:hypothetical protein DFH29DRAFT_810095 [Suillus ampliporus]